MPFRRGVFLSCLVCGEVFEKRHGSQIYCSKGCNAEAQRRKKGMKPRRLNTPRVYRDIPIVERETPPPRAFKQIRHPQKCAHLTPEQLEWIETRSKENRIWMREQKGYLT